MRKHPLVPAFIPVYGYVYDVKMGKLIEVEEATKNWFRKLIATLGSLQM
jgi:hypothetical protein